MQMFNDLFITTKSIINDQCLRIDNKIAAETAEKIGDLRSDYFSFIETLDPKNLLDATKILSWKSPFSYEKYSLDPNKYTKLLFREAGKLAHPDQCPQARREACVQAFEKIVNAKDVVLKSSEEISSLKDEVTIQNQIRNLDIEQADEETINKLFDCSDHLFGDCYKKKMRRLEMLLPDQVIALTKRSGLKFFITEVCSFVMPDMCTMLTPQQMTHAIQNLDCSKISQKEFEGFIIKTQSQHLLSPDQVKTVLNKFGAIYTYIFNEDQCKSYIQELNILDVKKDDLSIITREKFIKLLNRTQVKDLLRLGQVLFVKNYIEADVVKEYIEDYIKTVDFSKIDDDSMLKEFIFVLNSKKLNDSEVTQILCSLTDEQIKILKEKDFSYFLKQHPRSECSWIDWLKSRFQ